jgi:hypothetical protein
MTRKVINTIPSGVIVTFKVTHEGELAGLTKLVKVTEDVRKFAAEQGITEESAIEEGLKQKATEFTKSGAEVYAKA